MFRSTCRSLTNHHVVHEEVVIGIADGGFSVEGDIFDAGVAIQWQYPVASSMGYSVVHFIYAASGQVVVVPDLNCISAGPGRTITD